MKLSQICALVLLLVVGSAVAFADGVDDPKVIIQGITQGGGGELENPCGDHVCQGVGFNFSFNIPKSGSGFLYFTNDSGKNWISLALFETGVPANDVECEQTFFTSCKTKTLKDGQVEILLSGLRGDNPRTGIHNGQSFEIGFACVDKGCWPGGLHVTAHASAAPEPGTVALVMTGAGMIFSRRKVWKNRFNS
jgi:hypothetical protein